MSVPSGLRREEGTRLRSQNARTRRISPDLSGLIPPLLVWDLPLHSKTGQRRPLWDMESLVPLFSLGHGLSGPIVLLAEALCCPDTLPVLQVPNGRGRQCLSKMTPKGGNIRPQRPFLWLVLSLHPASAFPPGCRCPLRTPGYSHQVQTDSENSQSSFSLI